MKSKFVVCAVVLLSLTARGQSSPQDGNLLGRLKAAGFKCTPQAKGDICSINALPRGDKSGFAYSQGIAILVPKGLQKPANLLLHLHGHSGVCESGSISPTAMASKENLLDQMAEAGASNSVMVFPMSRGNASTYDKELTSRMGALSEWATKLLQPTHDEWITSAFSGGERAMAAGLSRAPEFARKVKSVLLLDANFNTKRYIGHWQKLATSSPEISITSSYTTAAGGAGGAELLETRLRGVASRRLSRATAHCDVTRKDYASALTQQMKRFSAGGSNRLPTQPVQTAK